MKVIFERQPLASGISLIHDIVNQNTTMAILTNVLLDANGEQATISGTDLESFGQVRLPARVEEAGKAAIPARLLMDIVRRLPEGDVSLETTTSGVTLNAARTITYNLPTMPHGDFPPWPHVEPDTKLTLRQADLKRVLHNTMFAIPTRDPRRVLMGVLFDLREGQLTCVATDGRKLGKTVIEPVEVIGQGQIQAIVPRQILEEIDDAIGEEGEIAVLLNERQILFELSNLTYISNRIEGHYPKYEAVIPESFTRTIKLQKTALADSIGRAAVVAERKHKSIVLNFSSGRIEISSRSYSDGSFQGELEIDYDGEPFQIAFNHDFLSNVFRIMPDAVIDMKIKDVTAPVVFEGESDPSALFLIMPVRMADLEQEMPEPEEAAAEDGEDE